MVELGVFGPEPKVELIEGVIIDKMGKNPPHVLATDLILDLLHPPRPGWLLRLDGESARDRGTRQRARAGRRWSSGGAVGTTPAGSGPRPTRPSSSRSPTRATRSTATSSGGPTPTPACRIYWLLDLNRRTLEVHSEPAGEGHEATYRSTRVYLESEEAPLTLDGREVARFAVKDILP